MAIDLGNRVVELQFLGRGHTSGDLVVWLPEERICFAGDLVEAMAAPYMGDAHIADWRGATLDRVAALGRGADGRRPRAGRPGSGGGTGDRRHPRLPVRRAGRDTGRQGWRRHAARGLSVHPCRAGTRATAASRSSSTPCRSTCSARGTSWTGSTIRASGRWSATGPPGTSSRPESGLRPIIPGHACARRPGCRGGGGTDRHDPGRSSGAARPERDPAGGASRAHRRGIEGAVHAARDARDLGPAGHRRAGCAAWRAVGRWPHLLPRPRAVQRPPAQQRTTTTSRRS